MASQMIEFYQFRCHFVETQKRENQNRPLNLCNIGNVLARVQWLHELVDLWDLYHLLHRQNLKLLVLLKPIDFEAQSSLL